ncbi:hypothetical protein BKA62DRAFT_138350 [Auriculariales sp. MPI-PUGE-AT-0066]|nr:hypothetical protein BKA62DRAFT_138350 [Auriculariales sp. MPI-PUGE-AT-0066]
MLSKPRTSARRYEHPSVTGAAHAGLSLMSQYKVWLPSTKPHDTEEDRARAAAHAAHAYAARDREYRERSDRDRAAERDRARRDRDREQREQELQLARHQERERQRAVERDRLRAAHSAAATATAATTSQQRSDAPLRPQPTSRPSYTTTATTATTSTTTTSSSANPSSSSHPQQQQQQQWHPGWAGPGQHPSHSSLSSVGSHIYSTAPTSVSSSLMSMSAKPAQRPSLADTSAVQSGSWRSSADRATVDRAEEDRLRAATVTRMAAAGSSTSLASADSGSANAPSHSRTDLKSAPHWFSGPSQQPPSASNAYGSRSTEIQLPGDGSRRPSVDKQSRRDDPRKANGYLSDLTETEAKTPRARSPIPPSLPFPANGQERGFKPAPSQPAPTQLVPPPVPSRGVSPTPTTGSRYESRSRADSQIEGTVSRPASAWSQYAASVSLNKALPAEDEVVVQKLQRSSSASVGQPPVHAYAQHGLAEPMTMPGPTRRSTYSGQPSRDSQTSTYGTPTSLTTASASMTQHMNNSRTSLNSAAPPAAFSPQLVAISRVPSTSAFVPTPAPISRVPSNSTFTPTPASMSRVPPNNTFVPTGASVSRVPSHNALPPPPVTMTRVPSSSTFVPTPAPNNAAHAPDLAQLRSPTQVPLQMSAFQSPAATRPSTALSGTYASSRMPISYTTAPITSVLASAMQSAQPHGANTRSTWSTHPDRSHLPLLSSRNLLPLPAQTHNTRRHF